MRVGFCNSLCTNSTTLVLCLHGLVQNLSTRYIQMRIATEWLIPITKCKRGAAFNSALSHLRSRRFPQLPCALMIIQKLPWMMRQLRQLMSAAVCDDLRIRQRSGVKWRSGEFMHSGRWSRELNFFVHLCLSCSNLMLQLPMGNFLLSFRFS